MVINMEQAKFIYDTIIIGAGPSGLTTALYTSRSKLKTLVLEANYLPGGQMLNTNEIENYPGFDSISGEALGEKMAKALEKHNTEILYGKKVVNVTKEDSIVIIKIADDSVYYSKTVVFATGTRHKHLGVKGEQEFTGNGVSYCSICDAFLYEDETVVVIGGGDSAVEESLYLANYAKEVNVFCREDALQAQPYLQDLLYKHPKIKVFCNREISSIEGDDNGVHSVIIKNTGESFKTNGVFIYIGLDPNSELINAQGNYVKVDKNNRMSVKGLTVEEIFAVGDVTEKQLRQISTAVGDGANAGQAIYRYLLEKSK